MSKKKFFINIILLFCIIVCCFLSIDTVVYAEEFNEVNFSVVNTEENYTVYLLLPEKYINYVNSEKNVNYKMEDIPGNQQALATYINYFNVDSVQKKLYEENGVRYLQVELTNVAHNFIFYIAPEYTDMDYKLRYTSDTRDVILHLNNFSYNQDGDCRITYDYSTNDFRTESIVKEGVNKYIVILAILLVVMCIVNMTDDKGKAKSVRKNY